MLEHKQDPGQGAPRIPLALLVRTGQGLLAGVGAPGRAGEGGVGGRFVHRVTFCAEGNEFRLFSAQSVTLCTKCSPRRPRRSSLSGWPSPAWSHKVASCGVIRVRGLVVGVGSEVSYQGRSPCRGACRLCRPVGVGAQGVCFRVELACRSCGGRGWPPVGGRGACWWRGVVLHIHPGVLVGSVAWFQRFLALGGVRGQDECATRALLHIHPVSVPWFAGKIRVIPPFTDRGL